MSLALGGVFPSSNFRYPSLPFSTNPLRSPFPIPPQFFASPTFHMTQNASFLPGLDAPAPRDVIQAIADTSQRLDVVVEIELYCAARRFTASSVYSVYTGRCLQCELCVFFYYNLQTLSAPKKMSRQACFVLNSPAHCFM